MLIFLVAPTKQPITGPEERIWPVIVGAVVGMIFLVVLLILIVCVVQKNRGKQYYGKCGLHASMNFIWRFFKVKYWQWDFFVRMKIQNCLRFALFLMVLVLVYSTRNLTHRCFPWDEPNDLRARLFEWSYELASKWLSGKFDTHGILHLHFGPWMLWVLVPYSDLIHFMWAGPPMETRQDWTQTFTFYLVSK